MKKIKEVTPEEAVKLLESKYHMEGQIDNVLESLEIRHTAIKALKKQIANSHPSAADADSVRCGNCVNDIEMDDGYRYCPYCGQKL